MAWRFSQARFPTAALPASGSKGIFSGCLFKTTTPAAYCNLIYNIYSIISIAFVCKTS